MSPRVPTVEYARSARSVAKSSQAATNSALSAARSEASRRRQAGSNLKNVNLTKVRSGTGIRVIAAALAVLTLACAETAAVATAAPATEPGSRAAPTLQDQPSVTVAILPHGIEPRDMEGIEGLSPGVMSAGLSDVAPAQTFLDISAGNRVFTSLYDEGLPVFLPFEHRVPDWGVIVERAADAPAEIVPGLLASTLQQGGVTMRADSLLTTPALMAANRQGRVGRARPFACLDRLCGGVAVVPATLGDLPRLIARLRGDDMLIAFERPPAAEREVLAIGAAGEGFEGNLTSDTTRTPGFVLATDLAPTILGRYGIEEPEEMSGSPIRSEGDPDAAAVQDRADRMKVVSKRRGPAVLRNMIAWFLLAALATGLTRGRAGRTAFALFGLSVVYLPALLLVGAALRPDELLVERLVVGLGAPALAALTLSLRRGWESLAIACGVTLGAYAIDVVAGSPLTAQSLLGPNPGLGVRFFGIGNELEAALAVVIPVGVGAALAAAASRGHPPARGRRSLPSWPREACPRWCSRPAASAPTSAPRSCSRRAPPWPRSRCPARPPCCAAGGCWPWSWPRRCWDSPRCSRSTSRWGATRT